MKRLQATEEEEVVTGFQRVYTQLFPVERTRFHLIFWIMAEYFGFRDMSFEIVSALITLWENEIMREISGSHGFAGDYFPRCYTKKNTTEQFFTQLIQEYVEFHHRETHDSLLALKQKKGEAFDPRFVFMLGRNRIPDGIGGISTYNTNYEVFLPKMIYLPPVCNYECIDIRDFDPLDGTLEDREYATERKRKFLEQVAYESEKHILEKWQESPPRPTPPPTSNNWLSRIVEFYNLGDRVMYDFLGSSRRHEKKRKIY